jgi:hypothetical protein
VQELKFGSFSLRDVFNREIQKHGRFAIRGKHTSADPSRKFVEGFLRADESENMNSPSGSKADQRKNDSDYHIWAARSERPQRPKFPFGTCGDDIHGHSWSNKRGSWLWVPKGSALTAVEQGIGFLAKRSEILRFGGSNRRIIHAVKKEVDGRSFAAVAAMDRVKGRGNHQQGGALLHLGDRVGPEPFNESWEWKRGSEGARERERHSYTSERTTIEGVKVAIT